jgi:hypothetical protein
MSTKLIRFVDRYSWALVFGVSFAFWAAVIAIFHFA